MDSKNKNIINEIKNDIDKNKNFLFEYSEINQACNQRILNYKVHFFYYFIESARGIHIFFYLLFYSFHFHIFKSLVEFKVKI
jgi:hypothetical protein